MRTPWRSQYVVHVLFVLIQMYLMFSCFQAYNPHIFLRNAKDDVVASNICSVVALGADDRSISVWQTKCARPLIVAKEVFERQIMDLSWYVSTPFWTHGGH